MEMDTMRHDIFNQGCQADTSIGEWANIIANETRSNFELAASINDPLRELVARHYTLVYAGLDTDFRNSRLYGYVINDIEDKIIDLMKNVANVKGLRFAYNPRRPTVYVEVDAKFKSGKLVMHSTKRYNIPLDTTLTDTLFKKRFWLDYPVKPEYFVLTINKINTGAFADFGHAKELMRLLTAAIRDIKCSFDDQDVSFQLFDRYGIEVGDAEITTVLPTEDDGPANGIRVIISMKKPEFEHEPNDKIIRILRNIIARIRKGEFMFSSINDHWNMVTIFVG